MSKILFFLSVFLFSNFALAQRFNTLYDDKKYIDSIEFIIKNTKSDSLRSINSFKLADLYRRNDNIQKFNTFLSLANKDAKKYPYLKDFGLYYNALNYSINGDPDTYAVKISIASKALTKYTNKESYALRAIIAQNLSLINQRNENEKESLRLLLHEAIPMAKKANDFEVLGNINELIGIVFMNNLDRNKANDYFQKANNYIESAKKSSPVLLESKVEIYLVTAENLLRMDNYSRAKSFLDKAFTILKKHPKSNMNGMYYFCEGLYFFMLNEFDNSLKSCEKGIASSSFHNDLESLNRLKFGKYKALENLKRHVEAKDLLLDLIENGNLFIIDKKNFYKELAYAFENLQDYKNAYSYSNKYILINDSIVETTTKKDIVELETKFKVSEKEKRISLLKAENERVLLQAENNKLYYGLFGLLIFILILIVILLSINTKSHKKLAIEKEKSYNQNLIALRNQKEIEVMQAMISGEEVERRRIARDLHDGVGSSLSALKMRLQQMPIYNSECQENEVQIFTDLLNNSISELRQVAFNLLPETLLKLGLELALHDLCHSLNTEKITIAFQANRIKSNISESNQITIFRIVQELINNALKHSNCTEIFVDCTQNSNLFFITVEDNGVGFDSNNIDSFLGLGLRNIKSRVELLNGKFETQTVANSGSVFNIELCIELV